MAALGLAAAGPLTTTASASPSASGPVRPAPSTQQATGLPVQVFVDGLTPRVVRPHKTVTVTGRLLSAAALQLTNLRVQVRVRSRSVGSRSELAVDAVSTDPIGETVPSSATPVVGTLDPGASASFRIRVPADNLGFREFGVYPFAVEALGSDQVGPNDTVGRTVTFLPWVPASGGFVPTRLGWLLPLVDVPDRAATPTFPDDHLASALTGEGRLAELLDAGTRVGPGTSTATAPNRPPPPNAQGAVPVTWAIDPALLQAVADMADGYRIAGNHGSTRAGAGQPAAGLWLDELRRALRAGPVHDDVLSLPYADVDVTALARVGFDADIATALNQGRQISTSVLGVSPDSRLAWAPDGLLTTHALDDLATDGVRSVVLREEAVPLASPLNYTPSAGVLLDTPSGHVTGLLADDTLSALTAAGDQDALKAAAQAPSPAPSSSFPAPSATTGEPQVAPTPTPAPGAITAGAVTTRLLEQRFLAETALITAEHPTTQRDVVVAPPPRWNPAPGLAEALVADTGRVPWLTPTTLSAIEGSNTPERIALTYPTDAAATELPTSYLTDPNDGIAALRQNLASFRSILAPPIGPTAISLGDATMRAESAAWRTDLAAGLALRQEVTADLAAKRAAVSISSAQRLITLASRRGTIPVTISNDLDQAVVVRLQLSAVSSARLTAPVTAPQTIAAGRKLTDEVKAVVNQAGLFPIRAQLLTPDGEPYGPSVNLRLRSTAYGQLALGITAAALGVLFVAVVVRLVRRARKARDREPVATDST
jgi:hypothetical protein